MAVRQAMSHTTTCISKIRFTQKSLTMSCGHDGLLCTHFPKNSGSSERSDTQIGAEQFHRNCQQHYPEYFT